jgi:hypothetical protein
LHPKQQGGVHEVCLQYEGYQGGREKKVRVILVNFKPYRDIMQGMAYLLWELGHILGVSFDLYDDVTPMELTAITKAPTAGMVDNTNTTTIVEEDVTGLVSKSTSPRSYDKLYTQGFQEAGPETISKLWQRIDQRFREMEERLLKITDGLIDTAMGKNNDDHYTTMVGSLNCDDSKSKAARK